MASRLAAGGWRSEEHTSELQSPCNLVCRLLLEKKNWRGDSAGPFVSIGFRSSAAAGVCRLLVCAGVCSPSEVAYLAERLFRASCFFFFNETATTEIYTLSLHDALPIYPGKRRRDVGAEDVLPELLQHALEQRVDVLAVDERRLDVHLGELHLAVGAQVLVPEAARDLEIPLHPGDHQDLLELLRGLRKGIELPRVDARGHDVFARPLGRALDRKSTRLNSSHLVISYAVFCLKKKQTQRGAPHRVSGCCICSSTRNTALWRPRRGEQDTRSWSVWQHIVISLVCLLFFFNDAAPTEISPLSLPAPLPI